jgi:hypothetical protein
MTNATDTTRARRIHLSTFVWPLVAVLSVCWSLFLLQAKLEAEVSSDPVLKTMLDDGSLASDVKVISAALVERLSDIPLEAYLLAGIATLVAYAALAWYDRIALRHLDRLNGISWAYVAVTSFVTYALGHNIGASVFSGSAVRLRAYTAKGLTKTEVATLVAMCTFTFAFGTALLLGVVLLFEPSIVKPLADILPLLAVSERVAQSVGVGLLSLCLVYVVGSSLRSRPLHFGPFEVVCPRLGVVVRQVLAAPLEIIGAAGIIYFVLPEASNPGYFIVLGAFLISFSLGLLSQVPGGVGVMEAVFLAVLPSVSATSVVAALLVWRLLYLLVPLALSGPIILAFEHRQFTRLTSR